MLRTKKDRNIIKKFVWVLKGYFTFVIRIPSYGLIVFRFI